VYVFAGLVLENWLLIEHRVLATMVIGIPLLLIVTEAICAVLYLWARPAIAAAGSRDRELRPG